MLESVWDGYRRTLCAVNYSLEQQGKNVNVSTQKSLSIPVFLCHPPLYLTPMLTSKWLTMNSFFPSVLTLFLVSLLSTTLKQCWHQITWPHALASASPVRLSPWQLTRKLLVGRGRILIWKKYGTPPQYKPCCCGVLLLYDNVEWIVDKFA